MDIHTATKVSRISLFTALIAVGSYIAVPIPGSPAPVVLANLFAILAGMVLGPAAGAAATTMYLIVGLAGLPVFAGGAGGLAHLAGPTGGFLVGYVPAAIVSGSIFRLLSQRTSLRCTLAGALAAATGIMTIYVPGVIWMSLVLDLSPIAAIAAGMLPFLPGDIAKAVAAALVLPAIERSPVEITTRSPSGAAYDDTTREQDA